MNIVAASTLPRLFTDVTEGLMTLRIFNKNGVKVQTSYNYGFKNNEMVDEEFTRLMKREMLHDSLAEDLASAQTCTPMEYP